jgi:release factor glutamine methyltransferase
VTDIREAGERLRAAGVPSPEHDARTLIRYAEKTGADPDGLLLARASRIPLQHLLGTAAFRYLELDVGPGVFVPRPETELLVDAVLAALGSRTATPTATATQAPVVVDLCAGSGAIGLSVAHEHPDAVVHLVESSPEAFDWLARNAARATPGRVHLHLADLAVAPSGLDGAVDVVVSNPPYLPLDERASVDPEVRDHDPALALWAQDEGLAVVRRVVDRALTLLRPGGTLVVEHSERHVDSAPALLGAAGFVDVAVHDDLTRRPRYTTGRRAC